MAYSTKQDGTFVSNWTLFKLLNLSYF